MLATKTALPVLEHRQSQSHNLIEWSNHVMTSEHNNINYNDLSELVNTAPAELCQACVGMLHSRYGDSFASDSEVAAMMNNVSYARATLFYSGTYGAEILSFFAGARAQRLLTPFRSKRHA